MGAMWPTWQQTAWLSLVCFAVTVTTSRWASERGGGDHASSRVRFALLGRSVLRETGIVAALYSLWQWVFSVTVTQTAGAFDRAERINTFERGLRLPTEVSVQQFTMRADWAIEFANKFYAYVHVPALGVAIVWLFFWHRTHYPTMRNTLALATGMCLAIQSVPVAPPRFLPHLGFVDSAVLFDQSVYGTGGSGLSNQLAAMPSVHVAWALIVAGAVIGVATSPWRWLALAHPIVTVWAVVATANHWWMDGIVAAMIVAVSFGLVVGLTPTLQSWARRARGERPKPFPTMKKTEDLLVSQRSSR